MRFFKLLLLIAVICLLSYFSWTYLADKSLEDKLERATLVMKYYSNKSRLYMS